jgi:hypothetical protein
VYTTPRISAKFYFSTEVSIAYLLLHAPTPKAGALVTHFMGVFPVFFWKMRSFLPPTFASLIFHPGLRGRKACCMLSSSTGKTPIRARVVSANVLNILSQIAILRFAT